MKISNKKFYGELWKYGGQEKFFGPTSRHTRRLVLQMIKGLSFSSLLDAGCGVGTLLMDIKKRYPNIELCGVEYAPVAISAAIKNNPGIKIRQLDLIKQSLNKTFDLVLCIEVLEHILDDISALKNLRKMTGKYFLLVVPTGPLFEQEKIGVGHVHGYSKKEILSQLESVGFKVEKKMSWGFPLYNIYRRTVMNIPHDTLVKKFNWKKKMLSVILYWLLFLNLPIGGEKFYVLCSV